MSADQTIDYENLAQDAMRGVVRTVMRRVLKHGLPGDHHFYIAFNTQDPGVSISPRLKHKYPEEMTIVMQHRFWDLQVTNERFEIKLTFDNIPERLVVPYKAIKVFFDPSVPYGLQFEDPDGNREDKPDQVHSMGQTAAPKVVDTTTGRRPGNLAQLHAGERDPQPAASGTPRRGAKKPLEKRSATDEATAKKRAPDSSPNGRSKKNLADTGSDAADRAADGGSNGSAKTSTPAKTKTPAAAADDGALHGDNDLRELNGAPPRLVSENPADDDFMTDGGSDLEKAARATAKSKADKADGDETADGDIGKSANVVSLDAFRKK